MQQPISKTKKLVITALFTALTLMATLVIKLPLPFVGYIHLGDGFVLLSALLLGPLFGTAAAGMGSALADVLGGYALYAPASLVIKSAMALACYFTYKAFAKIMKNHVLAQTLAIVIAALVMPMGYFLFETILYGTAVAAVNILWNLIQASAGIILSISVMQLPPIKKYNSH